MKMFIDFSISIALGWLVAWGLAALVGLAYPAAFYPVFFVLAAGWTWIGWGKNPRAGLGSASRAPTDNAANRGIPRGAMPADIVAFEKDDVRGYLHQPDGRS